MSTKYLARTAIEGGRAKSQRTDERDWTRSERGRWNRYLDECCTDREVSEDWTPDDRQIHGRPRFRDKLKPVYRWIQSRVGKSWADVRSEIKKNFDIRTTAGRHIVYCHLLSEIHGAGAKETISSFFYRPDFWIDENNILQGRSRRLEKRRNRVKALAPRKRLRVYRRRWSQIQAFLNGRRVRRVDMTRTLLEQIIVEGKYVWEHADWSKPSEDWRACINCEYPEAEHRTEVIVREFNAYDGANRKRYELGKYIGKVSNREYKMRWHRLPKWVRGEDLNESDLRFLHSMPYYQREAIIKK